MPYLEPRFSINSLYRSPMRALESLFTCSYATVLYQLITQECYLVILSIFPLIIGNEY